MAHFINEECTGCGVCEIKCPVSAVTGIKKERHRINPALCIDCSVCGRYCPASSILDPEGNLIERVKPKEIPKAQVLLDECSGCEICVSICPFGAIALIPYSEIDGYNLIASVSEGKCVGCRMCQAICIKEAIFVSELFVPSK
jgi:ferredoxin